MRLPLFISILLLLYCQTGQAQSQGLADLKDGGEDDPYEKVSYFMFGLNYLSNNVYLGRKDSLNTPYTSPYLGYHFKSGIFAKATASFLPKKKRERLDLLTLEGGYEHSFGDHFNGGAMVDKFFYNKNSTGIRSNTSGSTGIYGQFNNDWVQPQVTIDANFNKSSTDYVVALQLDHNFVSENKRFSITPAFIMNSGTQHYYDEYFINRLTKQDKTLKIKKAVLNASKFVPLDYELSAKMTYRVNKWLFTLNPIYAIPTSPATITLPKQTVQEHLANTFYLELDICHR